MAYTSQQLQQLHSRGHAMPPSSQNASNNPRFPVANANDLSNAIRAVGRARPNTDAERAKVRRYVIGRARALGLSSQIPDSWNSDGSLKPGAASLQAFPWASHILRIGVQYRKRPRRQE